MHKHNYYIENYRMNITFELVQIQNRPCHHYHSTNIPEDITASWLTQLPRYYSRWSPSIVYIHTMNGIQWDVINHFRQHFTYILHPVLPAENEKLFISLRINILTTEMVTDHRVSGRLDRGNVNYSSEHLHYRNQLPSGGAPSFQLYGRIRFVSADVLFSSVLLCTNIWK